MPSQPSPKQRWAPAFVLLLLGFVWGSSFILMKWGLFATDGSPLFPPVELAALRIAIAGFTLLPISLRHWRSLKKEQWLWVSLIGTVGSFIPAILFATAQTALPSAMAGMLNALSPIWTLLIGMAAFGIAVQRNQLGGIAIGFAGTIWLIQAQQSASTLASEPNPSIFIPSLLLVIATVCYGISVNITREKLRGLKSPVIAACSLGLVAMPASLIFITRRYSPLDCLTSRWTSRARCSQCLSGIWNGRCAGTIQSTHCVDQCCHRRFRHLYHTPIRRPLGVVGRRTIKRPTLGGWRLYLC